VHLLCRIDAYSCLVDRQVWLASRLTSWQPTLSSIWRKVSYRRTSFLTTFRGWWHWCVMPMSHFAGRCYTVLLCQPVSWCDVCFSADVIQEPSCFVIMHCRMHKMSWTIAIDDPECLSVCMLCGFMWLHCANTPERIKVLLVMETFGDPRNIVLDRNHSSPPPQIWCGCCQSTLPVAKLLYIAVHYEMLFDTQLACCSLLFSFYAYLVIVDVRNSNVFWKYLCSVFSLKLFNFIFHK